MNKIKVVTDSTVDMPDDLIAQYDIEVVPLSFSIDGQTYVDRVDITPEQFIEKMNRSEELPKSSQPPVGVFLELYDRLGREGFDVISIHMAGSLSGTVRSAEMAAGMSGTHVTVVDSGFISKALSFQVIEAVIMVQQGKSMEEIVSRLKQVREQTRLYVVVDTLKNLVKGGRIGKGKALVGSLLNIKPIASLEDGEYTPIAKVRSHAQAVKFLANQFFEEVKGKTVKAVGLAHAEGFELASRLKAAISEFSGLTKIDIAATTPIISTHTGAGAVGFMYYFE